MLILQCFAFGAKEYHHRTQKYQGKQHQQGTRGNATFVAAFPVVPNFCPTKIWSAILYIDPTRLDMMAGSANFRIKSVTFAFDKSGVSVELCIFYTFLIVVCFVL